MKVKILENEYWWAGIINRGDEMPYTVDSEAEFNINAGKERDNDQFMPLLVSSLGRYIWSEEAFRGVVEKGEIKLEGNADFVLKEGYKDLRGAYLGAMKEHFPFVKRLPHEFFWKMPQYNTWVELGHNQKQQDILDYAKGIIANGLPAGVLMIDDGWQEDFGVFEFNRRKIPDPKGMIDELHRLGFKVMLWVCPVITSAGESYKELKERGYLIKNASGEIAIREWWNGYSAVLDLTNPEAVKWYHEQLRKMMNEYGVDGFKFDAGDKYFYEDDDSICKPMYGRNMTAIFNDIGAQYALNEFRAAWKFGGQPIVARLHDKSHSWDRFGLNTLISHTITQGLSGYAYCCPDMVGGGIYIYFRDGKPVDEELFVRWAQANALMGMIQMSISPWKILSKESAELVTEALKLHAKHGDLMYELAQNAAATGEPIVRHMAYEFPKEDFETVIDQYMLGSDMLVAPVIQKGAKTRSVRLPAGKWKYCDGSEYEGGQTVVLDVDITTIPYFLKQK